MNCYELMLVLNPDLEEERVEGVLSEFKDLVKQVGGKITEEEDWGERRLAYAIGKQHRGKIRRFVFTTPPEQIGDIMNRLKLKEEALLRTFLARKDV